MSRLKCFLPKINRGEPQKAKAILKKIRAFGQEIGYQISKHNIPQIWKETEGEGITIAVLDTGFYEHQDLKDALIEGNNFSESPDITDRDGHSSFVSGVVTANNNDIGIVGVAPKAKILIIKVLDDNGEGYLEDVTRGIIWAVENKVDIINMSLGGEEGDPKLYNAIKLAYDQKIPVICAAGNSGNVGTIDYPANYPETIAIGALDERNLRADFSQTGQNLDFMAPGTSIRSTVPGNRYSVWSGTSFSSPWAAGVIALMMAKHRTLGGNTPVKTVEDVREHLRKTAIDLDQAGKDPKTGFGLIDAVKAIEQIKSELQPEPPVEDPVEQPEGDKPMDVTVLKQKLDAWVANYQALQTEKEGLEAKLLELNEQLATFNAKGNQILQLLG